MTRLQKTSKKRGALYIIDDRNALNLLTVLKTKWFQRQAEKRFFGMRKDIIQQHFSHLGDSKVAEYARTTVGLYRDQIISYVKVLEDGDKVEYSHRPKYVNPIKEQSCEQLYNPFYIKKLLNRRGFTVKIDKPFYGLQRPGRRGNFLKSVITSFIELTHPLSLPLAPTYHIKAVKLRNIPFQELPLLLSFYLSSFIQFSCLASRPRVNTIFLKSELVL